MLLCDAGSQLQTILHSLGTVKDGVFFVPSPENVSFVIQWSEPDGVAGGGVNNGVLATEIFGVAVKVDFDTGVDVTAGMLVFVACTINPMKPKVTNNRTIKIASIG